MIINHNPIFQLISGWSFHSSTSYLSHFSITGNFINFELFIKLQFQIMLILNFFIMLTTIMIFFFRIFIFINQIYLKEQFFVLNFSVIIESSKEFSFFISFIISLFNFGYQKNL